MQPANTISSIAFVAAGAFILMRARNTESRVFSVVLVLLGIGSAYYHATLTFTGQFVDVMGMYLVATIALAHGVNRRWRIGGIPLIAMYAALNIALAAALYWIPVARRAVFGAILITLLFLERHYIGQLKRAALILAAAFAIWIIDYYRIACAPSSMLQGHALWHVLGAVASWYLFTDYLRRAT